MLILTTERLRLRTIETADAPFYLTLVNDPTWIANIGDRNLHSVEAARAALEQGACAMQRQLGFSLYLMERSCDAEPIGLCGLIKRDTLPDVDIGYAVLPAYCGLGYAHEAASAVLLHARRDIGLTRLLGITAPDNASSNKLLRKLGMRLVQCQPLTPGGELTNLYSIDFAAPA